MRARSSADDEVSDAASALSSRVRPSLTAPLMYQPYANPATIATASSKRSHSSAHSTALRMLSRSASIAAVVSTAAGRRSSGSAAAAKPMTHSRCRSRVGASSPACFSFSRP
jgi:hypothetical protein